MTTRYLRRAAVLSGLVAILLFQHPSNARADSHIAPSVGDLVRLFDEVALGDEYGKRKPRVVKWTTPPVVRLQTLFPPPSDSSADLPWQPIPTLPGRYAFLKGHLEALSRLSRMPISFMPAAAEEGGTLVVSIVPRMRYSDFKIDGVSENLRRRLTGPGNCYFVVIPDDEGRIVRGHVVIAEQRDEEKMKHCFIEEVTQALGLPNDSKIVRKSIFNDNYHGTELTDVDRLMVRVLYDTSMLPGMDRPEAVSNAATLIRSLLDSGWFVRVD